MLDEQAGFWVVSGIGGRTRPTVFEPPNEEPMKMSHPVAVLTTLLVTPVTSSAAVSLYAEFHLGELGSLGANNLPQDSSGNSRHFGDQINGGSSTVGTSGVFAPGSSAYLSTAGGGDEGWYASGLFSGLSVDDFAFGVFASAASLAGTQGDVFTVGGSNGSLKVSLAGNGWAASAHNVAWIGGNDGVSGSFTADTWVHLDMIRSGGATSFYINGVPQGASYGGTPVNDTPHLSVAPGGSAYFDGLMDEARVVTFSPGESTGNILNALQGIPEPSTAMLGGLAAIGLLRRRRQS
jgi:hypothetical protein